VTLTVRDLCLSKHETDFKTSRKNRKKKGFRDMIVENNSIIQHPVLPQCRNSYYGALERAFLNTNIFILSRVQSKQINFSK